MTDQDTRAVVTTPLDPQALIREAVTTGAAVEVIERLVALAERVHADAARRQYHGAIADFHAACPAVIKTAQARIPTRGGGSYEFAWAPLAAMLEVMGPPMAAHGLSVSWEDETTPTHYYSTCIITHASGHSQRSGNIGVPIPKPDPDGKGATEQQRVGIARQYAHRYSFLAVWGLEPIEDKKRRSREIMQAPRETSTVRSKSGAPVHDHPRGDLTVTGLVEDAPTERSGETAGKKWTIYECRIGGEPYATFSSTTASLLSDAHAEAREVTVTYQVTPKGGRNILGVDVHLGEVIEPEVVE